MVVGVNCLRRTPHVAFHALFTVNSGKPGNEATPHALHVATEFLHQSPLQLTLSASVADGSSWFGFHRGVSYEADVPKASSPQHS